MFEGDSADTCAGIFPLVSMGAEQRVSRAQTRERGPPSALAELFISLRPASFDIPSIVLPPQDAGQNGLILKNADWN